MNREADKADHLKRIDLGIRRVEKGDSPGREETAAPFTFIFGVGTEGLSPLEMSLQGRGVGDVVAATIPAEGVEYVFGHLAPPPVVREFGPGDELQITVHGVAPAGQREIIQAMAEIASCGSDCCGH